MPIGRCGLLAREGRGVEHRRHGELRNGPPHAKKNNMTNRKIEYWVIPPEADGEFALTWKKCWQPTKSRTIRGVPVLCMDEQPVQLLKDNPPADPGHRQAPQEGRLRIRAGRPPPAFSCSPSHSLAGGKSPCANRKRKSTGRPKWRVCWKDVTPQCDKGDPGLRQPQHAHQGRILRGV